MRTSHCPHARLVPRTIDLLSCSVIITTRTHIALVLFVIVVWIICIEPLIHI